MKSEPRYRATNNRNRQLVTGNSELKTVNCKLPAHPARHPKSAKRLHNEVLRSWLAAAFVLVTTALLAAACGGGSSVDTPNFPKVVSLGKGELFPTINNGSLGVGENRVSMSVIDRDDNRVLDAALHVRYYDLNGAKPKFASEADARFIGTQLSYVDEQSGGEKTATGDDGVYVTSAMFDEAGDWGAEITVTRSGRTLAPIPFRFNVQEHSIELGIGDAAPASVQPTLATASSIEEIDSSAPPRPAMHDITIADALKTGKPLVIAFATPAFCRSRTCGPVMDNVMDPLAARYAADAIFIHVEPYVLRDQREANIENPIPATREWRLQSEPWVFVVDRQRRIAGKFEGIMAADEVEGVLTRAIGTAAGASPAPTP